MRSYDERAKDILSKRDEQIKETSVRRKKAARLGIIAAVLAVTIIGASVFAAYKIFGGDGDKSDLILQDTEADTEKNTDTTPTEYNDGVIGERKYDSESPSGDISYMPGTAKSDLSYSRDGVTGAAAVEAEAEEYRDSPSVVAEDYWGKGGEDYDVEYPGEPNYVDAVAGTLTAGEWKDADNIAEWIELLAKEDWNRYLGLRKLDTKNVITVKVKDGENVCFNVPVKLIASQEVIYTARTDINGCAYLFYNIAGENKTPDSVEAGGQTVSLEGKTELEIEAKDAGINVTALDLMLMIDTTGSMGDELEYIKAELYDVVERVAKADESLSIRVSVNFYRDEGDDYVVKFYDFRTDINECIEQLKEQHASGGGDTPEAVHTALDNAIAGHTWRDEAVKLCFIVLDAPPHSEEEIQGVNADLLKTVKAAAEQGIRIIPVASSGVDTETEFLLRSWSLMTGGTYVFITNDSGIGYGHKEAEVGEHTVEYLNECMVRIVCEYCGIYAGEEVPYTPPVSQNQQQ